MRVIDTLPIFNGHNGTLLHLYYADRGAALAEHGYDDAALRKITHENWIRVLRKTL